ncbi:MAG: hypothetical protein P8Y51_04510 [Campylobacterales bacterium]|jgi:hypothetical protein
MQTLQPDTNHRRNVIALLIAAGAAFLLATASGWLEPGRWFEALEGEALAERIRLVFLILFLPLLPAGFYVIRFGRNVLRSGRFPPPGTKVIRETRVRTGKKAKRMGYASLAYGIALLLVFWYGAFFLPGMLGDLIR